MTEPEYASYRPGFVRRAIRALVRLTLLVCIPLVGIAIGAYYYVTGGRYVSTENAYVKADKIAVSADVSGRLVEVLVGENVRVETGDLLLRIDDEPFRIARARAEAQLRRVRSEIAATRVAYREKMTERLAAEDDLTFYQREFDRRQELRARGVVPEAQYDEARHNLDLAHQEISTIDEQLSQILVELMGDPELPAERHPKFHHAKAELDQAELNLRYTEIHAPADGVVTKIDLQAGEYVEAGDPLFGLVVTDGMWVEANLKETDLTHVRVGQDATVRVDAYPDRVWTARIKSIGAATGAEFALLPAQNATGNWVKIVQRVPVRFAIDGYLGDPPLRAGMSVRVEVDTQHERELPDFVTTALAWLGTTP